MYKRQGKTDAGPHGDFIFEFDYIVGELMKTLKDLGIDENTLVVISSDNGPEVPTIVAMRRDHDHDGAHPWRGVKRDQWEGGHRVPFLIRWPGTVPAGRVRSDTICQTDLMATFASIVGTQLPEDAAEDSFSLLPIFQGAETFAPIRPYTLHQTISLALAIRRGPWKYLDHEGSGGNNYEKRDSLKPYALPNNAPNAPGQLYHLGKDPSETTNLYYEHPEIVEELKALLEESKASGRSRP